MRSLRIFYPLNSAVYDSRFIVNYYRLSADKELLFGGETYGYKFASNIKEFDKQTTIGCVPQLKDVAIDYGWGGTLGITMNRMPAFQKVGEQRFRYRAILVLASAWRPWQAKFLQTRWLEMIVIFAIMEKVPTPRFPSRLPFSKHLRTPIFSISDEILRVAGSSFVNFHA